VNEVPLIQGPVDIQWMGAPSSEMYAANALVTDRRFIVWWQKMGRRQPGLMVFDHLGMIPRTDVAVSVEAPQVLCRFYTGCGSRLRAA
jgi:hypothetical protein